MSLLTGKYCVLDSIGNLISKGLKCPTPSKKTKKNKKNPDEVTFIIIQENVRMHISIIPQ